MTEAVGVAAIRRAVYARPAGESVAIPKSEMADLPAEFEPTMWGTPLWIAHPGATRQLRGPDAMHAYDLEGRFEVHHDNYDPKTNPLGHFFIDAPELPIATAGAAIIGGLTYMFLEQREGERDPADRRSWFPVAVAALAAFFAWIALYLVGAVIRVAFGKD